MKKLMFVILIAVILSSGCSAFRQLNTIKNLSYDLEGINMGMPAIGEFALLVDIGIYNPNDTEVEIRDMNYTVYVNDIKIGTGRSLDRMVIKKKDKTVYHTRIDLDMEDLKENYQTLLGSKEFNAIVTGDVTFNTSVGEHTFPFELKRRAGK